MMGRHRAQASRAVSVSPQTQHAEALTPSVMDGKRRWASGWALGLGEVMSVRPP